MYDQSPQQQLFCLSCHVSHYVFHCVRLQCKLLFFCNFVLWFSFWLVEVHILCCNAPELVVLRIGLLLPLPFQVPVRVAGGPISLDGQEHSGASSGSASSTAQVFVNFVSCSCMQCWSGTCTSSLILFGVCIQVSGTCWHGVVMLVVLMC